MSDFEVTRRVVCIAGKISDAADRTPVVGARVAIIRWPTPELQALFDRLAASKDWTLQANRPDVRLSGSDGQYIFLDLPAGNYELRVDPPDPRGRLGPLFPLKVTVRFDSADMRSSPRPMRNSREAPAVLVGTTSGLARDHPGVILAKVTQEAAFCDRCRSSRTAHRLLTASCCNLS